ncbi:MAG: hypothetical protein K0U98_01450 [Deltaproteobacteria bacterium]|nr:hypothetical protein [Deltaproteobacteria bacterium]
MEKWLFVAGASIFGMLGTAHLVYTFFGRRLHPFESAVTEAMKKGTLNITKDTTVWKAWKGFNASHSFAALLIPGVYLPLALFHLEVLHESTWLSTLPVVMGGIYLVLAKKYWFKVPFFGILMATLCFVAAIVVRNL